MSRIPPKSSASGPAASGPAPEPATSRPAPEPGAASGPTSAPGPAGPADSTSSAGPAGARVGGRRVRPGLVLVTCCIALFVSSMNAAVDGGRGERATTGAMPTVGSPTGDVAGVGATTSGVSEGYIYVAV